MKTVNYSFFRNDPASDDPERAVLPTIMYAKRSEGLVSSQVLAIGWWAWGVGIIRTVVDHKMFNKGQGDDRS